MAKVLFLIIALLTYIKCEDVEQCVQDQDDFCICRFQDGRKIDISQLLANGKDNTEDRFLEADKANYRYFFHGCKDAKFNPATNDIPSSYNLTEKEGSLILYHTWLDDKNVSHGNLSVIGMASQIQYHVLDNEEEPYELIYKNKPDGNLTASFRLICEKFEKPYIQIIDDPKSMQFTLNSPHACILDAPHESSTGSTLLTIFFIVCIIYFVGGASFLYFARGARGPELIPNIDFWRRLPGLVKDGTLFLFGGCNATYISSSEAYDRI